jgi:hypothetical protein
LPTPARAAIEANAGDEWRRGKGGEAAIMESMETCERKPIEAWCKSWPEREAARPDESTAESGTAEPSPYRRAAKASAHHSAAEASARHPTAKATTHPAVKATSMEAATSAHPGIRCRWRCHRAREGDSGQRDYDFTHHGVSSICRVKHPIVAHRCWNPSLRIVSRRWWHSLAATNERWENSASLLRDTVNSLGWNLANELMFAAGAAAASKK